MRLLLLEPDARLAEPLTSHLRRRGHDVDWQYRADDVAGREPPFDAGLIDTAVPRQTRLRRLLRSTGSHNAPLPVILMTARTATIELMTAWDVGPPDCLFKPVSPDLLDARLETLRRRIEQPMACRVAVRELDIDWSRRVVYRQRQRVHPTWHEWQVLTVLAIHHGRTASKRDLLAALGGASSINAVEFHISRLRRKLGAHAIETLRGTGYRLGL